MLIKSAAGLTAVTEEADTAHGPVALVRAVIATGIGKGVVDHDGDAYDRGAFGAAGQDVLVSPWGHASISPGTGHPPIGAGKLREVGDQAVFMGELWLAMAAARDVFHVLRRRGQAQEWSYGYDGKARRPKPGERARQVFTSVSAYEVSPVWAGAGIGTHTLSAVGTDVDAETQRQLQQIAARVTGDDATKAALRDIQLRAIRRQLQVRTATR